MELGKIISGIIQLYKKVTKNNLGTLTVFVKNIKTLYDYDPYIVMKYDDSEMLLRESSYQTLEFDIVPIFSVEVFSSNNTKLAEFKLNIMKKLRYYDSSTIASTSVFDVIFKEKFKDCEINLGFKVELSDSAKRKLLDSKVRIYENYLTDFKCCGLSISRKWSCKT